MNARNHYRRETFDEQLYQVRFKNDEEEELVAPGYAAMYIKSWERDADTRKLTAICARFTEETAKLQSYATILFNSHLPVTGGKHGRGTYSLATSALIGGPAFEEPEEEDDPVVPTSEKDEPLRLDTVGPAADSWKLWRGGVTHTIQNIEVRGKSRVAIVQADTAPGVIARWEATIPGSSGGVVEEQEGILQIRNLINEDITREDALFEGEPMKITFFHYGGNEVTSGFGQLKLTSGAWAMDVKYCQ